MRFLKQLFAHRHKWIFISEKDCYECSKCKKIKYKYADGIGSLKRD